MSPPKKFMFVNRKAPYGTVYALESLEVVLISAAFEQDVSLVFVDDGVYQLKKGQQTKGIETKNFSPTCRDPISRSPRASTRETTRSTAWSTSSVGTGRLCNAR